jgi:transposase
MYVDTSYSKQQGKVYCRHLLRESYRENGKVKHHTVANLSHCSDEEIAAIKLALKHKGDLSVLVSMGDIQVQQRLRVGAVFSLFTIAQRLGLTKVLGSDRDGKLAIWQILARLIDQGSRLSAVRLAQSHAACDILGLDGFNEDHLYRNLAWLAENQEVIEQKLFRHRYGTAPPQLFLYDVTSSYLEGVNNILAAYGYNRDGKKGKQQLVIGLLTGPQGDPVAVRVFAGNTQDPKTIPEQILTLANRFGVKEVTLVGDRGMLKHPQLDLLNHHGFHFITAITKPQIRKLLDLGVFQINLFDQQLGEVELDGLRYILRRNPQRVVELSQNREQKLQSIKVLLAQKNQYLAEHPRAKVQTALTTITKTIGKLKLNDWLRVAATDRVLELIIDEEALQEKSQLDGCYVIKTDVPAQSATAQTIHDRYKDLAEVERAFRTFKNGHLEVRPTFVQTEQNTRGHVFVVMLAYLIERELDRHWRHLDVTIAEAIDELGALRGVEIFTGKASCQSIPTPTGLSAKLLDALDVRLPRVIPMRNANVATRRKLTERRK